MIKKFLFTTFTLLLLVSACTSQPSPGETQAAEPTTLTVMTHDSFSVDEELITRFEADNHAMVNFIKGGDTGSALNRLIITSLNGTPEADVFFGIDNTFLSRALEEDLFEPYDAPALKLIPQEFQLDPTKRALPIDYGDVCINYDKAWFMDNHLDLPTSLETLADPAYSGLLVTENPSTSSPGLGFMLATIAHFGEDGWLDWWKAMKDNDVVIVSDWETAYYTNFSGSSGQGPQPMVVSYASSPAAELIYAETELTESPTASVVADDACWRQVEFAGILKGTNQRGLAERFIDFMLGTDFQAGVSMQMFVYPVLPGVELPDAFVRGSQVPENPATLSPQVIADNRETWIDSWVELMLNQ